MKNLAVAIAICGLLTVPNAFATSHACGAPLLKTVNGKVVVTDAGKKIEVKTATPKLRANVTCDDQGDITVCSNGKYGCIYSNRSGNLLGCGRGI